MEITYTLDDVARTSDDAAVRRRFDQRNFLWLTLLFSLFGLVSFIQLANRERSRTPADFAIATVNFLAVVALLYMLRQAHRLTRSQPARLPGAGRWILDHISATSIAAVTVQYVLFLAFYRNTDGWVGWSMCMAIFLLGFRMLVAELVLMHVILVAGGLLMVLFGAPTENHAAQLLIVMTVLNAAALGIELGMSRRLRRSVTKEFSERRSQAREQVRMRDELRYARELQLSMLPECAPRLGWADICSISIPATEVGGDYYDYFVDEGRVALVCGDVAGHGMASGLVLATLRSGFTLLRDSLTDPAVVLKRLHELVAETSRRRMLVTTSVVLVDSLNSTITIASAGHPPVMLRRGDGSVETIDLFAPPLGVRLPVAIPQRKLSVQPGDVIVMHSDGIYETRNELGDVYGLDRLAATITRDGNAGAESLRDAILADVAAFRGSVEQDDDVTLVVCRITSPES